MSSKSRSLNVLLEKFRSLRDPAKAKVLSGFFKTGKGEYGEGDISLGITVPRQRTLSREFSFLGLNDISVLLKSPIHEHRLTGFLILVLKYQKGSPEEKACIYSYYMKNSRRANNWDLVDSTAPCIPGDWLLDKDRSILDRFAVSKNLWERRIAIISTLGFIRRGDLKDTFRITRKLMKDPHDLIHKACGWMLREAGKRDEHALTSFLDSNAKRMPRTMLRYAIERFPDGQRLRWMRQGRED